MDKPQNYYTKRKKLYIKYYILYGSIYMKCLEKANLQKDAWG